MDQQHEPSDDNVVYLPSTGTTHSTAPATRTDKVADQGGEVLEGELVSDAEYQAARARSERDKAMARWQGYRNDAVTVYRKTKTAVTHQHTKTAARHALVYPVTGAGVVWRRYRDAHGANRYERQMRAAEAAGDQEALRYWQEADVAEKDRRHRRVMDWVNSPLQLVKALAVGVGALAGFLLVLGIVLAIADKNAELIIAPISGLIEAIRFGWWFATAYGAFLLLTVTAGGLVYLWKQGRDHGTWEPAWLKNPDSPDGASVLVTADGIVTALQHLPIPALTRANKDGWAPRFDLTPTREGQGAFKGYRAIFDLPMGVTPEMVADKRDVLARNLNRNAVEVWPADYGEQKGGKPGFVNLYVADAGVMDKPTPEYPLLHEGSADVFTGVPIGITQRGENVLLPLPGSNVVFGGQPGQGKSNAVRALMLGAALDPLAELRVHVFAMNGDFDAFTPRLSRYQKGATTEHAERATEHLRELHAEVSRREERLAELGAKKLTRPISEKHRDMRPLIVAFSECHELFGNKEVGEEAADIADDLIKRGRKTGVTVGFDTQSARKNALPPKIVENIGINGCFAVKSWRNNDGFLGDGSFAAGIRATDLRFNIDRGTMVATGVTDELFEIVRTYYIAVDDDTGWDAAAEVIDRAMAMLAPGTPAGSDQPAQPHPEQRDLLTDVAAVLGAEPRVKATDVAARLRELAPRHRPYQGIDGTKLAEALDTAGVRVTRKDGYLQVYTERVHTALADQE